MSRMIVKLEIKIERRDMLHVILFMLYERDKEFVINRKSIMANLESLLKTAGKNYIHSKDFIRDYKHDDNYKDKQKKAESIFYDCFPDMIEEPNSLHFIKSK